MLISVNGFFDSKLDGQKLRGGCYHGGNYYNKGGNDYNRGGNYYHECVNHYPDPFSKVINNVSLWVYGDS